VKTADFNKLELSAVWYEADPTMRAKVDFPFFGGTGNKSSSVVYFEVEPGHRLGTHTDSAEEILLILAGAIEADLGQEQGQLSAGQAVLIPAMVPHGLRHGHKVWLDEDGHPRVVVEERMGHILQGVEGVYSHVTPTMEQRVAQTLQARWERSVKAVYGDSPELAVSGF